MTYEVPPIEAASGARRARRAGRVLVGVGALIAAIGGALLAIVLNVIPLSAVVPSRVHVTGPVVADARALFWVALEPAVGLVALVHGLHQIRSRKSAWGRFALLLLAAPLLAGAVVLLRSWL